MNKKASTFLTCLCLLGVAACSSPSSSDIDATNTPVAATETVISGVSSTSTPTTEPTIEPTASPSEDTITVDEQVLLDQDGIVVTLKSMTLDSIWGPSLEVLVENNTDKSVTVQTQNSAVNGVMIDTIFSCDIAASKKANDEIAFMSSDLDLASIEVIQEIEFSFHIFDSESWDTIFDSDPITITTSADPDFVQEYDDSGTMVLDQDGFRIVVKELESEDSFWGTDIYIYVENSSSQNATIQVRDMSVNGFMVDPIFSCDVLAGKKAFDTITFLESDLTDNGIETIETLEFSFYIFDTDSWDTILDSEPVTVSFSN